MLQESFESSLEKTGLLGRTAYSSWLEKEVEIDSRSHRVDWDLEPTVGVRVADDERVAAALADVQLWRVPVPRKPASR